MKPYLLLLASVTWIGCTVEAHTVVCGDGIVDSPEQCDDGNIASGDGCSSTCTTEIVQHVCGDGHLDASEQCDDGNTVGNDGCTATCGIERHVTATWTFKNADNTTTACPVGFDTVAVYSQQIDANGTNVGSPAVDLFNCADGTGSTAPLQTAPYVEWITVTNTNGSSTYATSLSDTLDLTNANQPFATTIINDGGYFKVAWTLVGALTNNTLTCAQAGADGADATSTVSGGITSFNDTWTCTDGSGITSPIPANSYTVAMSAINSSNQALGIPTTLTNKVIQVQNQVTDLGTVQLSIDNM